MTTIRERLEAVLIKHKRNRDCFWSEPVCCKSFIAVWMDTLRPKLSGSIWQECSALPKQVSIPASIPRMIKGRNK